MKPTKKRKKLILVFKSLFSLLIFAGLISLVILFFQNDYFKIKKIDCLVAEATCSDEEKVIFADLLGDNIFLSQTDNFKKDILSRYWQFQEIQIKKQLPHQLLITLKKRQPFFNLTGDEKSWWLIDNQGFVLQREDKVFIDLPQVFYNFSLNPVVGEKLEGPTMQAVIRMLTSLTKGKLVSYQKILVQEKVITLITSENLVASFSAQKNMQTQVDSLHFVLRLSKIEGKLPNFFDFRYDKPVVGF